MEKPGSAGASEGRRRCWACCAMENSALSRSRCERNRDAMVSDGSISTVKRDATRRAQETEAIAISIQMPFCWRYGLLLFRNNAASDKLWAQSAAASEA